MRASKLVHHKCYADMCKPENHNLKVHKYSEGAIKSHRLHIVALFHSIFTLPVSTVPLTKVLTMYVIASLMHTR